MSTRFIKIDGSNRNDAVCLGYLNQYFALREQDFKTTYPGDPCPYKHGPDEDELADDTIFVVAVNDQEKVTGGCRILFSKPGDGRKLRMETFHHLSREHVFPHLADRNDLTYCELGGVVAAHDERHMLSMALQLQKHIAKMIKSGECKTDIMLGTVRPRNMNIMLKAALDSHMDTIVRPEEEIYVYKHRVYLVTLSTRDDVPLRSPEMIAAGIGEPGDDFLKRGAVRVDRHHPKEAGQS